MDIHTKQGHLFTFKLLVGMVKEGMLQASTEGTCALLRADMTSGVVGVFATAYHVVEKLVTQQNHVAVISLPAASPLVDHQAGNFTATLIAVDTGHDLALLFRCFIKYWPLFEGRVACTDLLLGLGVLLCGMSRFPVFPLA
jgi:hypothetical protein